MCEEIPHSFIGMRQSMVATGSSTKGKHGACGVTQKKDDHRRHEKHFKKERSRERSHRFVNKLRAVIYRKNLDSFGQLN